MTREWKKGKQELVRHFLHKRVTRTSHVLVVQNNGKEMYKKSVLYILQFLVAVSV